MAKAINSGHIARLKIYGHGRVVALPVAAPLRVHNFF